MSRAPTDWGAPPFMLFMDESSNDAIDPGTESLTGLVVSLEKINAVRMSFYRALYECMPPIEGQIDFRVPEIHGAKLLLEYDDRTKLCAVGGLVGCVVEHRIPIVRVSYYKTPDVVRRFAGHPRVFASLNWFGIQSILGPFLEMGPVIPVFDAGFDAGFRPLAEMLAMAVRTSDIMRARGHEEDISIRSTSNLCEATFSDSAHSVMVQLVDLVSYLRLLAETVSVSGEEALTEFKRSLYDAGRPLEDVIFHDQTIKMTVGGGSSSTTAPT